MTNSTNLIATVPFPSTDGKIRAIATFSTLVVNNAPRVNQTKNGYVLSFPSNIYGDYGIKRLSGSLNNYQPEVTRFGVSINVSIFARSEAQRDYYIDRLQKGAKLRTVQLSLSVNPPYGVEGVLSGVAFIEAPADKKETVEHTNSEHQVTAQEPTQTTTNAPVEDDHIDVTDFGV